MERKYQIFISSTYVDLIDERQEVTKQILNNYHFPVGMEMFAPSDKEQWEVIEKTIDSSDIYILLLGYRYGSVTNTVDRETAKERIISYTEKEFEYAVKRKIPVIVFIKEDAELVYTIKKLEALPSEKRRTMEVWKEAVKKVYVGTYGVGQIDRLKSLKTGDDVLEYIYSNRYDRDQSHIEKFRLRVRDRLIGTFSKEKKIDIQAAIMQRIKMLPSGGWVKERFVKQTYLFTPKYLLILLLAVVVAYGLSEIKSLRTRLVKYDTDLFDIPADSSFKIEIARAFPDSPSLYAETADLGKRIEATTDSFSMFTTTFQSLKTYSENILNSIKKGAKFRILLLDTCKNNYDVTNSHWFYFPIYSHEQDNKKNGRMYVQEDINKIKLMTDSIRYKRYKGKIELRFYNRPMYFNMWIRDPGKTDGIAHFAISAYDGFKPVFRVTRKSGARLFNDLNDQFNRAWNDPTDSCWIDSKIISIKDLKKDR